MRSLLLDTAVAAIPNYGLSSADAEGLIGRAFELSHAVTSHFPADFRFLHDAEELLWACGCGPDFQTIDQFLELMDLSHIYSTNDVLTSYLSLFDRTGRVATEFREVAEFEDLQCEPPIPEDLSPLQLSHETKRGLLTCALHNDAGLPWSFFPGWPQIVSDAMHIDAAIIRVSGEFLPALPSNLSKSINIVSSMRQLVSTENSQALWRAATTASGIYFAIAVRALVYLKESGAPVEIDRLKPFAIGDQFIASLNINEGSGDGRNASTILEVCAQLVAGQCNRRVSPFGRPEQVLRANDKASAWRVHVTEAHEALRLMFWDVSGNIEFSNVGPKFELLIEEGDRFAFSAALSCFN